MKNLMFAAALMLAGIFPGGANAAEKQLDAVGFLTVSSTGFLGLGVNECAATLIGPKKILTAAHCLLDGDEYADPSDVTFHSQDGRVSVKVKRLLAVPTAEVLAAEGGLAPVKWALDWATAELETAPALSSLPLALASWSVVHKERLEMHVVGMPDGVMEHQSGCFSSPAWERDTDSWAEQTTQTLRSSEHGLARFLPKGRQADFEFWLDIGAMPHTCNIRPGYSGGPTLIKHPKHGFMVVGVNVAGVHQHSETEATAMYKSLGVELKPGERAAFGVSASIVSCMSAEKYSPFCEAGTFGAIIHHAYKEFMAVYDRHQLLIGEFGAAAVQAAKCGYSEDAAGINAYLDSGRTC